MKRYTAKISATNRQWTRVVVDDENAPDHIRVLYIERGEMHADPGRSVRGYVEYRTTPSTGLWHFFPGAIP